MRTGRPTLPLTLPEHDTLERWARRCTTTQALAQRARLILGCAAGQLNHAMAQQQRLDGLLEEPRPSPPRRITYAHVEHMVTRTLETRPPDAMHWSSRAMATTTHLS